MIGLPEGSGTSRGGRLSTGWLHFACIATILRHLSRVRAQRAFPLPSVTWALSHECGRSGRVAECAGGVVRARQTPNTRPRHRPGGRRPSRKCRGRARPYHAAMRVPIFQLDAFTTRRFAGNPAAVVVLDRFLDDALLQAVAAENNLAETGRVLSVGYAALRHGKQQQGRRADEETTVTVSPVSTA